jgi:lipopolysaccharide transport system ATP-binding protein
MSKPIIEVKDLSKQYRIGERAPYGSLREEIMQALGSPFRRRSRPSSDNTIWALKDVSFEVHEGEVLGIIGRNGAGKSTLLKILSRITEPTEGRVEFRGRVASLLEVGTGFHGELTGRENILLNGALLGMSREEIRQKFDEIVAFAEIEKFLDTPVKRYSSGMYVRLAFAVAAHLDPEILLIDEVLAVGDASFQKKCLGKMGDVARGGRTVLFVSHNMGAVQRLCTHAILLHNGHIKEDGESNSVIDSYLCESNDHSINIELSSMPRAGNYGEKICFVRGWLADNEGNSTIQYKMGEKITFSIELESRNGPYEGLHINIGINTIQQDLITTVTSRTGYGYITCPEGKTIVANVSLDDLVLSPGNYNVTLVVGRRGQLPFDVVTNVMPFSVVDTAHEQVVQHPNLPGFMHTNSSWEITAKS